MAAPPNGMVNLAGFFDWQPALTGADEIKALGSGNWHPATADFLAVMGSSTNAGMGDFVALMAEIVKWDAGSVKRVNFMTHSNGKTFAIRGYNTLTDVFFTEMVCENDLSTYGQAGTTFTSGKSSFTIDDVRAWFATDAMFVVYGCNSGLNLPVLSAIGTLLKVKVVSFKEKIVFCPPPQSGSTFNRKGMKIGLNKVGFQCAQDTVADWLSLATGSSAITAP